MRDAIETRLRMIIPYIDKWPQALATLTLSRAVPTALSNLLTLVDDICYYAGDRSVDVRIFNCDYNKSRKMPTTCEFMCEFIVRLVREKNSFGWYL